MIIHTYEKGERGRACEELITERLQGCDYDEVIILPIPSTRDGVTVKDTDIPLVNIIKGARRGVCIMGYGIPAKASEDIFSRGASLYDAGEDEEFLVGNAELTALCALGIILNSERRAPKDISFGIVGYGRIGKSLTRMLLFLGAGVRVFTSRGATREALCEWGVASSMSAKDASVDGIDILINTAPAVIFDEGKDFSGIRVIDLASGNNFPGVCGVESYPSVPAKMFHTSAGRLYGECPVKYFLRQ